MGFLTASYACKIFEVCVQDSQGFKWYLKVKHASFNAEFAWNNILVKWTWVSVYSYKVICFLRLTLLMCFWS
jgi:hypothetical protein